jgi:hypothetical protein
MKDFPARRPQISQASIKPPGGVLSATSPAAYAQNTSCNNVTLTGVINGNVVVVPNRECDLEGATVTGNVLVGTGAFLFAGATPSTVTTISGNVIADGCAAVQIIPTANATVSVEGNVTIRSCTGGSPGFGSGYAPVGGSVGSVTIGGNFICQFNSLPCFALQGSIGGNANVSNNSGSALNASDIESNVIDGNLLCFGNAGGVTNNGHVNKVAGKELGQCAPPF